MSLAVDNSGGPLNGTLYVSQTRPPGVSSTVQVYARTGGRLGAITGVGTGVLNGLFGNAVCGTAVDQSSGALYVAEGPTRRIWRLMPTSPAGAIDDTDYSLTGISTDANNPCELGADSGNVYVSSFAGGKATLERYAASSFSTEFTNRPSHTTVGAGSTALADITGVSVDSGTGEIYVNEGNRVAVFDAVDTFLYRFGLGAYLNLRSEGIAVRSVPSGAASKVYVSTPWQGQGDRVAVFGAPERAKVFTNLELDSFGADGTTGSIFSSGPYTLAFDQATRKLYSVESDPPGIRGYDASSPPSYPLPGELRPAFHRTRQ